MISHVQLYGRVKEVTKVRTATKARMTVWFDNIRRGLITSGALQTMIDRDGLRGITSNPSIFEKALAGSGDYDPAIRGLVKQGVSSAQSNLATLYVRGQGVPRDLGEAYLWFSLAADAGYEPAQQGRAEIESALGTAELDRARERARRWQESHAEESD